MLIFFALELASATFACLMQLTLPSVYITTAALCSSPFRQQSFLPFAQFCGMAPSALYLHFDTAWGYYYYYWRGRRGGAGHYCGIIPRVHRKDRSYCTPIDIPRSILTPGGNFPVAKSCNAHSTWNGRLCA